MKQLGRFVVWICWMVLGLTILLDPNPPLPTRIAGLVAIFLVATFPPALRAEHIDTTATEFEYHCPTCHRPYTERQGAFECLDPNHRALAEVK